MATYTAEAITVAGTVPTPRTAAAGDKLTPDTNAFIRVTNGGGSSMTITFAYPGVNADGEANPDPQRTIAAGATKGILVSSRWADPADGLIALTWSSTTSVTFTYERV
ncbi:hypothetical protein [Nonomuraea sediminis]|uniref:hypothetical protein n=1 Tax=Nonomuraea sediminis TaxID=2835864 RepID=UPI001BDC1C60|nr:hypothetical protein [Nonomuraea sediminis]